MPFFLIIIISILAGTDYYLAHRLYHGLVCFLPNLKFWMMLVLVSVLLLFLVLGFGRSTLPISDELKHLLGIISGYCMGFSLYLFLFTVVSDLLMLVPRLMSLSITKHPLTQGIVTVIVLFLTCVTCVGGFIHGSQLSHVSYDISLSGKKDISDLNIVLISDLHLGAMGSEEQLEEIVAEINSLHPDVICVAGDFFDTDFSEIREPKAAVETLKKLDATYGTYVCLGNHDGGETHPEMVDFLAEANLHLLDDSYTIIDERLVLVGRLDATPIGGYGAAKRQELSAFFTREDASLPVIVLDHNPARIDEYQTEADLILCGHTHQGQVFPGSLITDALYTVDYGYYQKDSNSPQVIVTSGVGSWGMPMRVGTDREIVSIQFTCDSQNP